MAAVEVTISGVLFDKLNRTTQNVVLIGEASLTGLGVGGGPMPPGPGGPVHIWGGGDVPMPSPPIANVPGAPGYQPPVVGGGPIVPPPTIWPPGPGIDFPSHPIVIPPPVDPGEPGIPPGSLITWKPVWTPDQGWMIIGVPNVPHPAPSK